MKIDPDYLGQRARLQEALRDLLTFAVASQADQDRINTLHGLQAQLDEPFLFVVAGEVKAGKSSLLNALFGEEICRVDVLPATDRIHHFKFGDTVQDIEITPHLVEMRRPVQFLRDFHIVDTPGTNSIIAGHQTITEQFAPLADLILFVFTVTNPWGASAWDFLALLQTKWLKKVVFVVQQCDLRSPEETNRVVEHLRQTSLQRTGVAHPIFPVSARHALEGRQHGDEAARTASGLAALEEHIQRTVTGGEARREKLQSIQRTARVILGELRSITRAALEVIDRDTTRLESLQTILAQRREQSLRQVGGFLRTIGQACDKCRLRGEELLRERLTLLGTLQLMLHKGEWHQDFQKRVESDLQEAVQREVTKGLDLLEGDLKNLWQSLHENLRKDFADDQLHSSQTTRLFLDQRADIVSKLDLTLLEQMSDRRIEEQLKKLFGDTAIWLRVPGAVAAVGGVATIVAALTHVAVLDVTGTIAAVGALGGTALALFKRGRILREYSSQMQARRDDLEKALEGQLNHAIALFYQDLTGAFAPLQDFCQAGRTRFTPLLNRADDLDARLLAFQRVTADAGNDTGKTLEP